MKCEKCGSRRISVVSRAIEKFGDYIIECECLNCKNSWTKEVKFGW